MQSYKDIYLAFSLLALSSLGSWMSFSALEDVERPLASYETAFAAQSLQYSIFSKDKCVGSIESSVEPDRILISANSQLLHETELKRASAEIDMTIDGRGYVTSANANFAFDSRQLRIILKGTNPLELKFEVITSSGKNLKHLNLPGAILIATSESGFLEVQHPYISRSLRFIDTLLAEQLDKTLRLRPVGNGDSDRETCDLDDNSVEVSELIDKVSALTRAWENLTAGRKNL